MMWTLIMLAVLLGVTMYVDNRLEKIGEQEEKQS